MEFKRTYTKEDSEELIRWIDTHPTGSITLANGIKITNIEYYLKQSVKTVKTQYDNPTYCGFIYDLFCLKDEYEKRHSETSDK